MSLLRRYPIPSYFLVTFAISWFGAFLVASPYLLHGIPIPKFAGLMMFPAMLLGPSVSGIFLARVVDGPQGLRDLFVRMRRVSFAPKWFAGLAIPPIFVLTTLFLLRTFISPDYSSNRFYIGAAFGVFAGFFEEIGWTGFAFPKLRARFPLFPAALILGLLWGCWHIPVIDYLGTATPHGDYWLHFFLAFVAAMAAIRILIAWLYSHTKSVLLAQLLHAFSTGSLVVFSPPHITGAQEAFWYATYAILLWLFITFLILTRRSEFFSPAP